MSALRWLVLGLVGLFASGSLAWAESPMPWQPNLETAQQVAAQSNRLVLIHFWSTTCQPCMRVEREVFSRPEVAKALDPNFVLVKINVDEAPGTARFYGVSSIPTDVITLPNGRLVSQIQSPPTANQYIAQINQAYAGHRELSRKTAAAQAPPAAVADQPAYGAVPTSAVAPMSGAPAMTPPATAAAPPHDRYADSYPPSSYPPNSAPAATAGAPAPPAYGAASSAPPAAAPQYSAPQNAAPQYGAPASAAPQGYGPATTAPPAGAPAGMASQAAGPPQASAYGNGYAVQPAYQPRPTAPPMPTAPQLPPGCPPLALDGNCPVTLVNRHQWSMGDKAYGVIHRGRTYLFLGPSEKEAFFANPDAYSPVLSGNDPVLALDNQVLVPGKREFGVFGADKRIYLFADEATRVKFEQNPKRYAAEAIQAMR